jgi:flagellar basal-body rod protein FlgF
MDKLIYTAMTGAKHALEQQATTAHNLANVNTTGFRAQLDQFRAVPVLGEGLLPTRAFVVDSTVGSDMNSGPIEQTGRDLDVAVQGKGWIAVQAADGSEAYTRNGSLQINENGLLQTATGLAVASDGGTLSIPPGSRLGIAKDGTVSIVPDGSKGGSVTVVGKIKLVNPADTDLVRGDDGLFRLKDGATAEADPTVNLVQGALESSNVNAVNEMVNMITLAREYDLHMKLLQNAEGNANKASQLLSMNG